MRKLLSLFVCSVLFLGALQVNAQLACPFVNAGPDTSTHCGACVTLNATVAATQQTTSYTVAPIPYAPPIPYNVGTPILVNIDDRWSNIINLPFTFCFFGNSYNSLIAGSNGVVSFNTANQNTTNNWNITGAVPSATPTDMVNSIMGPWHDIDPSVTGLMRYQIAGTAPCRMIVFSWQNVAMYSSSCNNLLATHQIVLYENSNIIDVYIQNKPLCTSWNNGAAIEGIQNAAGTVAYVVPGRNYPTQWTATNDAWRFAPAGLPNYSVSWFGPNGLIGTGNSVSVCPATTTTYTAVATYALCGNANASVNDDVTVTVIYPTDSVSLDTTICIGQTAHLEAFASGGVPPYTYFWDNGVIHQDQFVSPTSQTTYTVVARDDSGCVTDPLSITVSLYDPLSLAVSPTTAICQGDTIAIHIHGSGGNGGPYTALWNTGETSLDSIRVTPMNDSTYTVVFSDGCTIPDANGSATVKVNPTPVVDFSPRLFAGCQPLEVQFTDISTNVSANANYSWNFGDGKGSTDLNPVHIYPKSGRYDVVLDIKTRQGCENSDTIADAVIVYPKPVASFKANPESATILFPDFSFVDYSSDADKWNWDFGDNNGISIEKNPFYKYSQIGTYPVQLIVTSDHGCLDTTMVEVIVDGDFTLYVPKAFTPNGDGQNDYFSPSGYGVTAFDLTIFDRWGTSIYHTNDINQPWDGRVNNTGRLCQEDVYIYKLTAYDYKNIGHEKIGYVSLVY